MPSNRALQLAKIPEGLPVPGQDLTIVEQDGPHPSTQPPPSGGFIAQTIYISLDPSMRLRMIKPEDAAVFPAVPVGSIVPSGLLVKVLKADPDLPNFKQGDILLGIGPIQEYLTVPATEVKQWRPLPDNPLGVDTSSFMGPLGLTGLVAYASFYGIVKPKKGETILVSAATGAVGHVVGQLAKREGLKVIGVVGSDEKVGILTDELGFDGAINYKSPNLAENIKALAPDGIDIFYDLVSGSILETALGLMKDFGRIVAVGAASQINLPFEKLQGIRNVSAIISKNLTITGFSSRSRIWAATYEKEWQHNVQNWIHDGSFKSLISRTHGFENVADGIVGLLTGKNVGKAIVDLSGQE